MINRLLTYLARKYLDFSRLFENVCFNVPASRSPANVSATRNSAIMEKSMITRVMRSNEVKIAIKGFFFCEDASNWGTWKTEMTILFPILSSDPLTKMERGLGFTMIGTAS